MKTSCREPSISDQNDATRDLALMLLAARHALEANGVSPDRLVLDEPIVAGGGIEARHAEVRLR